MFLRCSRREAKNRTHNNDQALFEPLCKTSSIIPQNATELENTHVPNLGNVTPSNSQCKQDLKLMEKAKKFRKKTLQTN